MSRFSIRNPYFIIVVCLVICVIGGVSVVRMPVDLFPQINLPEVVVATFYSGMPPEDIEVDITNPLERFFTLAAGIDHVTFLYGVSKFLFSALALAFCISLLVSFVVAMTVIPLFCSHFLTAPHHGHTEGKAIRRRSVWDRFNAGFNTAFEKLLNIYESSVRGVLRRPGLTVAALLSVFVLSLGIFPFLGLAFFPRTDAGQFTINLKAPTGSCIEVTEEYVKKVENLIRQNMRPQDYKMTVSNIGVANDFSSLYTSNAGAYTATVQAALQLEHKESSFFYMDRVRESIANHFPELRTFFQSGSMVDAILNSGMPVPIDVQVTGRNYPEGYRMAQQLAAQIRGMEGVDEVYIPQDVDYPALRMNVDRVHAGELGLNQKDIVQNVITAINSNQMIAPNYWVDYKTGNDYYLTV